MNIKNKKIGIWGFGVTGQSILRYFSNQQNSNNIIEVFEQKAVTAQQNNVIVTAGASLFQSSDPLQFIEHNDLIIASPGINKDPYLQYANKFITEVDLFYTHYQYPIVAITGATGKTSITHLLGQLCTFAGLKTDVGGNIGTGMLDLITHDRADLCILELSSFQLEYATRFAPDLAIITNLYENHLDRHQTMDRYFEAKSHIMTQQTNDQMALLPLSLITRCNGVKTQSIRHFFSWDLSTESELLKQLEPQDGLFFVRNNTVIFRRYNQEQDVIATTKFPALSLKENWLIIVSALHLLNIPVSVIAQAADQLVLPAHRLEKVITKNGITFYNDSKSTTPQATLAAVNALQNRPIHLLLGGLGKGVDRAPLIAQLKGLVHSIYCFGGEADELYRLCGQVGVPAYHAGTLEESFDLCMQQAKSGDQILLSPAGASYDLFKDYQERGEAFKHMAIDYGN
ncbi:MAG TPA: UDP-N-acetylmuramoyl-L-alanine--D-glutamate ligase [Candidatus Babeliales bacterium]|nr:UDP-N-acetylmuramoyl-L-alanine--D-glutamate ligase [Candidatus Babeliales bacterium]